MPSPVPEILENELIAGLSQLAGTIDLPVDPMDLRAAAQQALREVPADAPDRWLALLRHAGEVLGLRVETIRATVAELCHPLCPHSLPLLTPAPGPAGSTTWVLLTRRRGRKLRLEGSLARWAGSAALLEALGRGDANEPMLWAAALHAAPLAPIRSHEGPGGSHHRSPHQRIWALLRAERSDISVLVVYAAAVGLLSLVTPIAVQALVNSVAFGTVIQPLVVLTVLVFLGMSLGGGLRVAQYYLVEIIQRRIFVHVTADLAWRLPRVPLAAFDREHGPELVNRFFDVLTVQKASSVLLLDGIALVLQAAIGMSILAFYHPLFLAFDAVLAVTIALVVFGLGRGASDTAIDESKAKYAVAAWLQEMALHPDAFRSSGTAAFAEARADDLCCRYLQARRGHFHVLLRQIIGAIGFQALMSTLLLGIGGWLVIQRQLTIGQLVAAELIVSAVVAGLAKFGKHLESYYDLAAAMDKLGHLTDLPMERASGQAPAVTTVGAEVQIRDLGFAYEGGRAVLAGLDLTLRAGARVAVVAESDAGKTTLAEVLSGLRSPTSGTVRYDGVAVHELSLRSLREQVALLQAPQIFHGTISDNVSMGRPGVGPDEVRVALQRTGLYDDLTALPEGLATQLPTGGTLLSSGQRRRLMVARAVSVRPRLVVIDAVTDGIARSTQHSLLTMLLDPEAPWTVLLLTRDAAVAALCQERYQLAGGKLLALPASGEAG